MADGLGQCSPNSSDVQHFADVELQEGSATLNYKECPMTTGGNPGTDTEPLEDTPEPLTPLDGGHECGAHVLSVQSSSNTKSDKRNRKLLVPQQNYHELVGHVATSSHHAYQETIQDVGLQDKLQRCEAEKRELELELGKKSFLEDKRKRNEKAFQSCRLHVNEQSKSCSASGASYAFTGMKGKLLPGAGPLQEPCFLLQQRLLEISNSLSDAELRQMFLAIPRVNAFQLAKIRERFKLFGELDTSGELCCTYMYVRELLKGIHRFDLLEKVDVPLLDNAESADGAFHTEEGLEHEPSVLLQKRLLEISNSLSDVELRQMKFLAKPRVNAFRLAKIREGFELFEELDTSGELSCNVRELLKGIRRFDLLEKLEVPLLDNTERADGAFHTEEGPEHEPTDGAFHMEEDPELEPRSQPPTGQKMLDRITDSSVIPPRDHNLDLLSVRHDGCDETSDGIHIQCNEGNDGVSGINEADSVSNMSCGNSENTGNDMAILPMMQSVPDVSDEEESVPACRHCDTTMHQSASGVTTPTDEWTRLGAIPKNRPPVKRNPLEPSLVEPVTTGLPDALTVDSSKIGIDEAFVARHSQDTLLESLSHQCSTEKVLSDDASSPGASYMERVMNYIESTRVKPYTGDDQVAFRPDEHNRLSLQLLRGGDERGDAVGGSTFNESLNAYTGPGCTQNSDHLIGNMACVVAGSVGLQSTYSVARSNGTDNGLLETESTAASQYALGNASSNLLNTAGDQVALEAVVFEPCCAESSNSRDSMLDRNAATDRDVINSELLALAQRTREVCAVLQQEGQRERERQREARIRAWEANGRLQGQTSPPQGEANPIQVVDPGFEALLPFRDFILESLGGSNHNSARALARREAAGASTEEVNRGPSSRSGPGEHSCVCLENEGNQACSVYGTIMPERCRPDSEHNTCCKCLEVALGGFTVLPCSHPVHRECVVGMIWNSELNCPICGHAFLERG